MLQVKTRRIHFCTGTFSQNGEIFQFKIGIWEISFLFMHEPIEKQPLQVIVVVGGD